MYIRKEKEKAEEAPKLKSQDVSARETKDITRMYTPQENTRPRSQKNKSISFDKSTGFIEKSKDQGTIKKFYSLIHC